MVQIKQAKRYERRRAVIALVSALRKWFPPGPLEIVADVVDATEAGLKEVLPGYHVRVSVERIDAGIEGGA